MSLLCGYYRYVVDSFDGMERVERLRWLAHVASCSLADLPWVLERSFDEARILQFEEGLERLDQGEPLAYLIGFVPFGGLDIAVGRSVLIPRPETELLWELVLKYIETRQQGWTLWDVCTGSGCLGLALKYHCPRLAVTLSDICGDALKIAKHNRDRYDLDVRIVQGDFLQPFQGEMADMIVVNPPYVALRDRDRLDRSVVEFEPELALFGGEDGLDLYRRLAEEVIAFLRPGGVLALELGIGQLDVVTKFFSPIFWRQKKVYQDLAGVDRFFFLEALS
jgi:release factor glutamine methyltransferase